jgi:hypothetical protein
MPDTVPEGTYSNQFGLLKAADLAGLAEPTSAGFSVW